MVYKVPPEPSANRVSTWSKLKRLGAILLHDAVWVLPCSPRTDEQFQWLASDIRELGGEAFVWRASLALDGQDEALVRQFLARTDALYTAILAADTAQEALIEPAAPGLDLICRGLRSISQPTTRS